MQVCSINIRGLGVVIKKNKRKIRSLVSSHRLEFLAVQETDGGC